MRFWVYNAQAHEAKGPFTVAELKRLDGFGPETLVAPEDAQNQDSWRPAKDFEDMRPIFLKPPPPPQSRAMPGGKQEKPEWKPEPSPLPGPLPADVDPPRLSGNGPVHDWYVGFKTPKGDRLATIIAGLRPNEITDYLYKAFMAKGYAILVIKPATGPYDPSARPAGSPAPMPEAAKHEQAGLIQRPDPLDTTMGTWKFVWKSRHPNAQEITSVNKMTGKEAASLVQRCEELGNVFLSIERKDKNASSSMFRSSERGGTLPVTPTAPPPNTVTNANESTSWTGWIIRLIGIIVALGTWSAIIIACVPSVRDNVLIAGACILLPPLILLAYCISTACPQCRTPDMAHESRRKTLDKGLQMRDN